MINHLATMVHLLSLPLTPFEKARGRNKIGKWAWVYLYAKELYSRDVEDHSTGAMAQPKSRGDDHLVSHLRCTDNNDCRFMQSWSSTVLLQSVEAYFKLWSQLQLKGWMLRAPKNPIVLVTLFTVVPGRLTRWHIHALQIAYASITALWLF